MTGLTGDARAEKIIRSLKENSAELSRELRAERKGRSRRIVVMCLIFVTGLVAGALLVTAL